MLIIDKEMREKLLENGKPENKGENHLPVVQVSILGSDYQWLLTELDPEHQNIAFGLCDLGMGFPEMGYVDLKDIQNLAAMTGLVMPVICIRKMDAKYPLMTYWRASLVNSKITMDEKFLMQASHAKTQ